MDTPKTIFVRRYRTIRYLFWFCLFLSVVGALAGTPLAFLFALPALVLAFASIFQRCPQCQEHVGFKRLPCTTARSLRGPVPTYRNGRGGTEIGEFTETYKNAIERSVVQRSPHNSKTLMRTTFTTLRAE